MDINVADQLSSKFESQFSAIIPEIIQLIQQYKASGAFELKLRILGQGGCRLVNGFLICISTPDCNGVLSQQPIMELMSESLSFDETSELDLGVAQQFWKDIASDLFESVTLLGQSIQDVGESFEVHFFIDTATVNAEQPIVCQWFNNDILRCSNS